jgi:hypothetical protein
MRHHGHGLGEHLFNLLPEGRLEVKTATLIHDNLPDFTGHAALYRLDPPLSLEREWDEESKGKTTEHVVVSATQAMFTGPETYIFPADAEGAVTSWGELDGSYRGGWSHSQALEGAGYTISTEK